MLLQGTLPTWLPWYKIVMKIPQLIRSLNSIIPVAVTTKMQTVLAGWRQLNCFQTLTQRVKIKVQINFIFFYKSDTSWFLMAIFKELNNFIKAEGLNKVNLERFQSLFCFNIRFDLLFPITTWWITAVARFLILPVLSVEQNVFKLWLKIYGGTQWRSWYRNCAKAGR